MKKKFRLLSTILSFSLFAITLSPATVNAANLASETVIASDVAGERTNIQYLEGTPGDTHLVYTYVQGANTYKAVENATKDFKNVECQIYQLNEDGIYVENSTQCVFVDSQGNPIVTIESAAGNIEKRTIDISSNISSNIQSDSSARISEWEWITQYYDGSRGDLKGLAISALIAVVASVATYYSCGALTASAVAGASAIATGIFGQNADKVYYHAIRNWRHSPKNYFVIDETEWTEFFLDSSHIYSLGHTYAEYIF